MELKDVRKDWEFILSSSEKGSHTLRYNPIEWRDTEYGIKRDEYGMAFTFSGSYTFVRDGYKYIREGLRDYGILWVCNLEIVRYDSFLKKYVTVLPKKKLDFTNVVENTTNGNSISVPIVESEFLEAITARRGDAIPYGRLVTLAGKEMQKFEDEYIPVLIYGQETLSKHHGNFVPEGHTDFNGNNWVPSASIVQPDGNTKQVIWTEGDYPLPLSDAQFAYTTKVAAKVSVDYTLIWNSVCVNDLIIHVTVEVYSQDPVSGEWTYSRTISDIPHDTISAPYFVTTYKGSFRLNAYEGVVIKCNADGLGNATLTWYNTLQPNNQYIRIEANEKADPMVIDHITLFNLHTRMIEAITGKPNAFRSSVFEKGGKWANVFVSNGYLYRRFPTDDYSDPAEINKERLTSQLAFKLPDLTNDLKHILGVGYGIGYEDGEYYVFCEDESYFFQDEVSTVITDMGRESFSRTLDIDFFASTVVAGTEKKDYERDGGLLSFNTLTEYSTILSNIYNEFYLKSEIQIDGYLH